MAQGPGKVQWNEAFVAACHEILASIVILGGCCQTLGPNISHPLHALASAKAGVAKSMLRAMPSRAKEIILGPG